jgi:hypothetical protein
MKPMATRNELTGSNYFNVQEIKDRGGSVRLTIESVGDKEFTDQDTGKKSTKFIISFLNEKKMLTRGKSNINEMFDILPDDTDDWEGEKVELYVGKVDFGGKRVDGVKVRRPTAKAAKAAAPKAPIEESTDDAVVNEDEDAPY